MRDRLERFINSREGFTAQRPIDVVLGFAYFLHVNEGMEVFFVRDIKQCYDDLRIPIDLNIADLLNNYCDHNENAEKAFFVEKAGIYSLSSVGHKRGKKLYPGFEEKPAYVISTRTQLEGLADRITDPAEKAFLEETIKCYEIGAYRAAVVMMWALAIDHLRRYILANTLPAFNQAVENSPFSKTGIISEIEDFVELNESVFIELCEKAGIIRKNTKGTLVRCLTKRNQAAHANTVAITEAAATAHIEDLVKEVINEFPL